MTVACRHCLHATITTDSRCPCVALVAASCGGGSDSASTTDAPARQSGRQRTCGDRGPRRDSGGHRGARSQPIRRSRASADESPPTTAWCRSTSPKELFLPTPRSRSRPLTHRSGSMAAYEFGPDGLEFAEPATLTWNVEMADAEPGRGGQPGRTCVRRRRRHVHPVGCRRTAEVSDDGLVALRRGRALHDVRSRGRTSPSPSNNRTRSARCRSGDMVTFELAVTAVNGESMTAGRCRSAQGQLRRPTIDAPDCRLRTRGAARSYAALPSIASLGPYLFVPMTYRATCSGCTGADRIVTSCRSQTERRAITGPVRGSGRPKTEGSSSATRAISFLKAGASRSTFDEVSHSYYLVCLDERREGNASRCELIDFHGGLPGRRADIEITEIGAEQTFMTVPPGVIDASDGGVVIVLESMSLPVGASRSSTRYDAAEDGPRARPSWPDPRLIPMF